MSRQNDLATISVDDVVHTLLECQRDWKYSGRFEPMLAFASELTGLSEDALAEMIYAERVNDGGLMITDIVHDAFGDIYEVRLAPNRFILVEASNSGVVGILGDMPERSAPLVYDKEDHLYPNFEYDERAVTQFVLDYIIAEAQKNVAAILREAEGRSAGVSPIGGIKDRDIEKV